MAVFRDYEARERGFDQAKRTLIPRELSIEERREALQFLEELVSTLGPVVDAYPSWHPLVSNHKAPRICSVPNAQCGYEGLDHTVFFAHGFVTCPYNGAEKVIASVNSVSDSVCNVATLRAESINVPFYSHNTDTVIVRCSWHEPLDAGHLVPKRVAVGLMLDHELPNWHHSEVAETWETMQGYFLGQPHGARSSLFVNQETAMAMKRVWNSLINSGVFGPIFV